MLCAVLLYCSTIVCLFLSPLRGCKLLRASVRGASDTGLGGRWGYHFNDLLCQKGQLTLQPCLRR